jgi:5'-3' exonuclease
LYLDFAILRGDPSDGLPGVRGIGEKIAASLVSRYGDLDSIIAAATSSPGGVALGKVRGAVDYIERARRVCTIPTDLPIADTDLTRPSDVAAIALRALGKQYGISDPIERLVTAIRAMS